MLSRVFVFNFSGRHPMLRHRRDTFCLTGHSLLSRGTHVVVRLRQNQFSKIERWAIRLGEDVSAEIEDSYFYFCCAGSFCRISSPFFPRCFLSSNSISGSVLAKARTDLSSSGEI